MEVEWRYNESVLVALKCTDKSHTAGPGGRRSTV